MDKWYRLIFFHQWKFAALVRYDLDVIVPILSYDNHTMHWKDLPAIIERDFSREADMVVCTHRNQVSQESMDAYLVTVAKAFWPSGVLNTSHVIPCSSVMGLSARDLLDRSNTTKPPFETIWDKHAAGYYVRAPLSSIPLR